MKYVVLEHPLTGWLLPLVFPEELVHADMVPSFTNVKGRKKKYRVVSAGFCQLSPKISAHGKSESLKVKANPELDRWLLLVFVKLGLTPSLQALPMEQQRELVTEVLERQKSK